ncbi:MAG TPA: diguanylate cyclase [Candidatus Brocadiaceae bacterium]|nr:diguanylate cyclase [Candidatus Brocadiaceae bacterium]
MIKIAVIGAGTGGSALLDVFHTNGNIEIVGITDKDKNAPGLNLAKEWGVFIAEDIKQFYSLKPDIVINATGKPEVSEFINESFPYSIEVVDGLGAKLLWELVSRQQKAKKDMETLYQNGLLITRAKNLKDALDEVLRSAMELTETPAGSIALLEGDEMVMTTYRGFSQDFSKRLRWKLREGGLTCHILKQMAPVELQVTENDPIFENIMRQNEGIKSILASSLLLEEGAVGILYLNDFKPREFTERHKRLLRLFSTLAAQTIEKYKLLHDLEESLTYLQDVLNDSQDMIIVTDREGRFVKFSKGGERILGYRADEVIGSKVSEFYVNKNERANILKTLHEKGAIYNYETKLLKKDGSPVDISLTISVLRNRTGCIIGTVGISKDITEEKRLREELKQKNKELEELSIRDSLTNVYNRRYAYQVLESEFNRAKRYKTPLSCLLVDADRFKKINDQYGHMFGDKALVDFASLLQKMTRSTDIVSRFGGEEFLVILPDIDMKGAADFAERLRGTISKLKIEDKEKNICAVLTISIGASSFTENTANMMELIHQADIALYEAKRLGRDRVCCYKPPLK